jgi:hypothetical protein
LELNILFDEICAEPSAKARCEKYAQEGGFRNLGHFLESLVLDKTELDFSSPA